VSVAARHWTLATCLFAAAIALGVRAADLQVVRRTFLAEQGDARFMRVVARPAYRGMLLDRRGEPLAVSTPMDSVWACPPELLRAPERIPELAAALGLDAAALAQRTRARAQREFMYLRRAVPPQLAEQVMARDIPGVYLQREYRRYYPGGEVFAHVLGHTNVDDRGIEGLEAAYEDTLRGIPGRERIIRDRDGRRVETLEILAPPRPGDDLRLSIDKRVQYLAYRELKSAVARHRARSGSAVVLDVRTGEVLAMVNQPAYNPNERHAASPETRRNRAVTDLFEPGSTMKPFTIAAALEHRTFNPATLIDTSPGTLKVGRYTVRDVHSYGVLDMAGVLRKSSNVGAARIGLSMTPPQMHETLARMGFGRLTGTDFPGEAAGVLPPPRTWRLSTQVTLSYGYGVSLTALQLTRAYAALATGGLLPEVGFRARPQGTPGMGRRVLAAGVTRTLTGMLEGAVATGGTGTRAQVAGYRVAGKTGTARLASGGSYASRRYLATFVGFAPASAPRLAMLVSIHEPQGKYYGGEVAAPVFGRVMAGALRLLGVAPDVLVPAGDGMLLDAEHPA
jgi:cell division protein FtsI (penicillin-binding protein 3)